MRVGINLLYLVSGKAGGTETYIRNLLNEFLAIKGNAKVFLFVTQMSAQYSKEYGEYFEVIIINKIGYSKFSRIIYEQSIFPFIVAKYEIDVLFSPGYVIPVLALCKHVVTIHDMLYKRFPSSIELSRRIYWTFFVYLSVLRSKKILAVSEFSKNELTKFFPNSSKKIIVTFESVDNKNFYKDTNLPDNNMSRNYALSVATLSPHKNFEMLLKAIKKIKDEKKIIIPLLLVGNKDRSTKTLLSMIENLGIQNQVKLIGFVTNDELRSIYSNAALFVLPSIYEGFGLPVLEAMACGCPVLCSNAGSLPEVGGSAAIYFDPFDLNDIAKKLEQLWKTKDSLNEIISNGYVNVTRFSWENSAQITWKQILN